MDKMNIDNLLEELDLRYKHFLFSRSITPYIDKKVWDSNTDVRPIEIDTASLYKYLGYNAKIQLSLENVSYEDWHDAGTWINKSFIISIYAILDHWGIINYIRGALRPIEGVDKDFWELLYNLRHSLAHSSERFTIQKTQTSDNFLEAVRLQKKLFPLLIGEKQEVNLDVQRFISPFFEKLRFIMINELSKFSEFYCDKKGKLTGVQVKKQGKGKDKRE